MCVPVCVYVCLCLFVSKTVCAYKSMYVCVRVCV